MNQRVRGHGDKSLFLLSELGIALTEEERMCIRWHMGAFEKDTKLWRFYTNAVDNFINVLWTHQADMIASHKYNT